MGKEKGVVVVVHALLQRHALRAGVRPPAELGEVAIGEGKRQASLLVVTEAAALAIHYRQRAGVAVRAQDASNERLRPSQFREPAEPACTADRRSVRWLQ
jgi:hypothetical protein